jgi:hypothetical protein
VAGVAPMAAPCPIQYGRPRAKGKATAPQKRQKFYCVFWPNDATLLREEDDATLLREKMKKSNIITLAQLYCVEVTLLPRHATLLPSRNIIAWR